MRLGALLLSSLASAAAALAVVAPGPATGQVPEGLQVTGWTLDSSTTGLLDRNTAGLTTLSVAGVTLAADGGGVSAPNDGALALLAAGQGHDLATELLISNYSNATGDFDAARNHRLLSSPRKIDRVATRLAGFVTDQGWDGINVDLELVRADDGPGLVAFAQALQDQMPPERTVSIDISASTTVDGYEQHGYRLADLAATVDVIDLMTYDQHGPGWSGPGPIGALPWQRDSLDALLTVVPPGQVQLGVAGYGYTWPRHGTGRSLGVRQARGIVHRDGATPHWRAGVGEWTARLSDGTIVWWSDRRSYALRVDLAREAGVRGLAVWRIGSADTLR